MLGKVTTSYRYCTQLVHFVKIPKSEYLCKSFVHVELKCEIHCFKCLFKLWFQMVHSIFWCLSALPHPPPIKKIFVNACTYTIYACWWSFSLYRSVNNWMFLPTSCARVSMSQRTYACIVSQASDTINFKQLVHLSFKTK